MGVSGASPACYEEAEEGAHDRRKRWTRRTSAEAARRSIWRKVSSRRSGSRRVNAYPRPRFSSYAASLWPNQSSPRSASPPPPQVRCRRNERRRRPPPRIPRRPRRARPPRLALRWTLAKRPSPRCRGPLSKPPATRPEPRPSTPSSCTGAGEPRRAPIGRADDGPETRTSESTTIRRLPALQSSRRG